MRGSPRAQAERRLKAAGFRVDVRREFNDDVPENRVIETSPSERSRLERGRTVTLVVSRGPRMVEVPDVVGKDRDEAERLLEARGLQVSFTEREDEEKEPGTVLADVARRRAPRPSKGATVTLTVAKEPKQVAVPDVLGEQVDDAVDALEEAGFRVRRREQTVDDARRGRRRARAEPAGGREARQGLAGDAHRRALRAREPRPRPGRHARAEPDAVRVAVLAGGRSSEHQVSLDSAATVQRRAGGGRPRGARRAPERATAAGRGRTARRWRSCPAAGCVGAEVAFPVLHGPFGEDGTIQGLLELLDVPYVGAGVLASSLCMDKVVFKEVLAAAGVPQVGYLAIRESRWQDTPDAVRAELEALGLPLFVKPARLGSSVGISKVAGAEELDGALETAFQHDALAIVEAFSPGIEVECSVTGLGEPEASLPAEVVLQGADWYDYEAKYAPGGVELEIPARVGDDGHRGDAGAGARDVPARGLPGLARVDFFVEDGGRVLVNELNTLPGMTATSGFPKMWEASGRSFPEVCDRLLRLGLERYRAERAGHAF